MINKIAKQGGLQQGLLAPQTPPAAKSASQGDAHVRSDAQIKFLYYPLSSYSICIKEYLTYLPVVTLSTENNEKLLQQLKSRFKRTINWNKFQSKVTKQVQNQHLDYLIDPSFQGVSRLFIL